MKLLTPTGAKTCNPGCFLRRSAQLALPTRLSGRSTQPDKPPTPHIDTGSMRRCAASESSLLLPAALLLLAAQRSSAAAAKPHVIAILADDYGWADAGCTPPPSLPAREPKLSLS